MSEHVQSIAVVTHAHVTVWWADQRQRLGGASRRGMMVTLVVVVVAILAALSFSMSPEVETAAVRARTARAVYPIVFIVGAMVWSAFSLALPDAAAVDTLLTAVPARAVHRRVALGIVTLVPAVVLTVCLDLAVCGGLVSGAHNRLVSAGAALAAISCAVAGMGCGAMAGGLLAWTAMRSRLLSSASARGVGATIVVGLAGVGFGQVMGAIDRPPSLTMPLTVVGWTAAHLDSSPALAFVVAGPVVAVGLAAVLAGAALARAEQRSQVTASELLARRLPRRRGKPTLVGLEYRQLVRFQPNVGALVMLVTLALAVLVTAGGRSALFATSAYFGLSSLLSTTAVTVAGVQRSASWLYLSTGRRAAHLASRLTAYLLGWGCFVVAMAFLLVVTTESFGWWDALSVWPLFGIEVGVVLAIGALLPVTEENGVASVSAEFGAMAAILVLGVVLPKVELLTSTAPALVATSLLVLISGVAVFVWREMQ